MRIDRRAARREIVEDDAANEFTRFWGEIAVALKFLDLDIRTGKFEGDGKTYMAVVNQGTTEVAKLATRMTPAEIALFRVACWKFCAMIRAPSAGSIS